MAARPIIRSLWFAAALAILCWWFIAYGIRADLSPSLKSESQIYLIIAMVVLSFPVGLIWTYLFALVLSALSQIDIVPGGGWQLDVILLWVGYVVVGYLQWFELIPRVVARFRMRREPATAARLQR